jgi:hypothetical protein
MARKKAMTRSDLISLLKSRGTKGRLSKMTKPQLKALVEKTAPPDDGPARDETRPKAPATRTVARLWQNPSAPAVPGWQGAGGLLKLYVNI